MVNLKIMMIIKDMKWVLVINMKNEVERRNSEWFEK
jgi:hypothetical protein